MRLRRGRAAVVLVGVDAQRRAALARVDADLAAARLRLARLETSAAFAGPHDAAEVAAAIARAEADIAELEARREGVVGAPAEAPAAAVPAPPAPPAGEDDMLTTREAAAVLRVTVKGLERMRAEGRGPPFTRIGKAVRYRRGDLRRAK